MLSVRQRANEKVIRYLERRGKEEVDDRPPRGEQRDYWEAGSHPEIVERIWDQLGRSFPAESRRVVCGSPVLLQPASRVILAVAIGTQYAIRLPSPVSQTGPPANARTETVWSDGARMDVRHEFGSDWVFGSYSAEEETWCLQSFKEYSLAGSAGSSAMRSRSVR